MDTQPQAGQNKQLLIVFVKNILLGKVKTRLAASIGNQNAFEVYKTLVEITERETDKLSHCDVHIWFSDAVVHTKWHGKPKFVQEGIDLGARMKKAFEEGFKAGYQQIIGVGSDLPELNAEIIQQGFDALNENETVFGPAADGGYYLIGMKQVQHLVFENKPWSTEQLLNITLHELEQNNISCKLLPVLNDIDTLDDLKSSPLAKQFAYLWT